MNSALGAITTGPGRVIFMLAGIVILCVVLYYLYKYMNGDAEKADMVVFANSTGGLPAKGTEATIFSAKNIPAIYGGGEYSVCVWIYIANWKTNENMNKTFLILDGGDGTFSTLQMYMGARTNKMGIRVSTDAEGAANTLDSTQQLSITNVTSPYNDNEANFAQGDIKAVDLQKWVCICVVLSGRRLDVYMDGKLNRSSVLNGMYKVGGTGTSYRMKVGGPNGFGGLIGQINAANYAYTPDRVWALYSNGPQDTSITSIIKSYFDPGQYSFSLKRNGEDVIAGSLPDV